MIITEVKSQKTKAMHEVLRQIPYNLFAVGVGSVEHASNAFLGSWVTQCSFDPPRIAIAIRKDTNSHKLIEEEGVFTINLLRKDQEAIARKLVKPSHRVGDKLGTIAHTNEVTGAPLLSESLGFVECKVMNVADAGDHSLVIGEVVNAAQFSDEEPLTCHDIGWTYAG